MNGASIKYGDYSPGAKENFTPNASEKPSFVDLSELQSYNLDVKNYANPCEYGMVLLDGSAVPFPASPESEAIGYWSNSVTKEDKTFDTAITLSLTSTAQYSSQGFTFTFDTDNNIFPDSLAIKWYRADALLSEKTFSPDSAFYFCAEKVDNFDKAIITFASLNMPHNRLRIRSLDFGYGTIFGSDELSSVNVIQEIDNIGNNLSINVVDFNLKLKNDFCYSFQNKQKLSVYFNDSLIQSCFVDTSKRTGKREWKVSTIDYVGLLDSTTFMGGMYESKNAVELLESIFEQTNTPYEIDSVFDDITLTGYIPICTCREAIKQICFAMVKSVTVDNVETLYSAVVDTAYSDKVKIKQLSTTIASVIPLERIMQGQSFDDDSTVTSVKITGYQYEKDAEGQTTVYNSRTSGTGTNILVTFSNPLYGINITNGTINSSGANYAYIDANANCTLRGYEYTKTEFISEKSNSVVSSSDAENIVEFNNFTLVSQGNIDTVLKKCYNESIKVNRVSLKIAEGKSRVKYGQNKYGTVKYGEWVYDGSVKAGDLITAETEYLGNVTGRIVSQRYNLNGGILIKECEMI